MIATIEMTKDSEQMIDAHGRASSEVIEVFAGGLAFAAAAGAESVREQLNLGQLGLTMQHPGDGLAAGLDSWMVNRTGPVAALGIRAGHSAGRYARILNDGGVIVPKTAKALAVPISDEAKKYESPRDMDGLEMIPRKGRPPLLVRKLTRRGNFTGMQVHWILLASVTIPAFGWFDKGVDNALPKMLDEFAAEIEEWANGF